MSHKTDDLLPHDNILNIFKIPKSQSEIDKNLTIVYGETPPRPQLNLGYNEFAMKIKLPSDIKPQVFTINPFGYPILDFKMDDIPDDIIIYEIKKVFNLKNPVIELDPSNFTKCINTLKTDAIIMLPSTYLMLTTQIIEILSNMYTDVYIYKPLYSPAYNHDKYLICIGFVDRVTKIKVESNSLYELRILNFDSSITDIVCFVNIVLLSLQQSIIGSMNKFIKDKNYYGEVYKNSREVQINNLKRWVNTMNDPEYLSQLVSNSLLRNGSLLENYNKT